MGGNAGSGQLGLEFLLLLSDLIGHLLPGGVQLGG